MPAATASVPVSDQLKEAIDAKILAGLSLRQISIEAGVSYSMLYRFVKGERGLNVEAIDRLAEYLQLRLTDEK